MNVPPIWYFSWNIPRNARGNIGLLTSRTRCIRVRVASRKFSPTKGSVTHLHSGCGRFFFFLKLPYDPSTYLLASPSYSSKFVICKSSSSISLLLWIGPAWAPLRKFGYDDLSEVCSVWSSTVTVARAVTRVTVELDESESTAGVLWCWFCRLLLRPLLLWGPLLWRLRLPTESDDSSPCLVTMHSSESVGGVPCLQVEFGRNSLFDPTDEAVRGGETSSIFIIK